MELPIDGRSTVYGILGWPVAHSLSPLLHNTAFRELQINAAYIPFSIPKEKLNKSHLSLLAELGLKGFSLTIPHKAWAAQVADQRDNLTNQCGAANTLYYHDNLWSAYNTDGPGALQALQPVLSQAKSKRVLLLGYGGSATAIAHALLNSYKEAEDLLLYVGGRNAQKIEAFTSGLKSAHPTLPEKQIIALKPDFSDIQAKDINIIIHTTPLGLEGQSQELPLPTRLLDKEHCVFDIVYQPLHTPLVHAARSVGAQIVPGYLMLLYQAGLQFEIFTGQSPPIELMQKVLEKKLGLE